MLRSNLARVTSAVPWSAYGGPVEAAWSRASSRAVTLSQASCSTREKQTRHKSTSAGARQASAAKAPSDVSARSSSRVMGKGKAPENARQQQSTGSPSPTETASAAATAPEPLQEKPSFSTSSSQRFAKEDQLPLPTLSAPLGVGEPPTSRKLSWAERREQQFDHDRRMAKRKAIIKEATRGYFHDFHAMRSHGGKTWIAPSTLIRQDRALYFPAIEGTSIADKEKRNTADMIPGKVSIVTFLTSQVSELHAKSFYEPCLEAHGKDDNFQLIQINLQENVLKAYLVGLFVSAVRKQVPEALHPTYLLSHQDLTMEREALRLDNKHVGYTYLVGPDAKVRWAGCAFANAEEQQSLVVCAGVLLSRMASGGDKAQGATQSTA